MASRVEVLKFLASAFNMVKKGDIKSLQDLFNFAKQQFGQVDDKLSKQITDTFEKGKAASVTEKRTKQIIEDKLI
jgi:polyhydroxyalkanoate synthesis regulator phasin